jgi:hypothetical protein
LEPTNTVPERFSLLRSEVRTQLSAVFPVLAAAAKAGEARDSVNGGDTTH